MNWILRHHIEINISSWRLYSIKGSKLFHYFTSLRQDPVPVYMLTFLLLLLAVIYLVNSIMTNVTFETTAYSYTFHSLVVNQLALQYSILVTQWRILRAAKRTRRP